MRWRRTGRRGVLLAAAACALAASPVAAGATASPRVAAGATVVSRVAAGSWVAPGATLVSAMVGATVVSPVAAGATLAPPVVIDGPSPDIVALGNVAIAQDGSGALVYTKLVSGVAHAFVSVERGGAWAPGVQVDTGISTAASAPSIAVADDGRTAVVWISGGELYGAVEAAATSAFSAPQPIAAASGTPALGMGISGTGYVAYLGSDGTLDVAWLYRTQSTFAPLGALSSGPVTLAPSGGGPAITVAADATAVVAWSQEAGGGATDVYVRRASSAGPSPVLDNATVTSLDGAAGGSADSPSVGVAYDSSDAWIAFRETVGGVSRVIIDELLGDELRPPAFADSLAAAPDGSSASAPSLAIDGNYQGLVACGLVPSGALSVAAMGTDGAHGWSAGSVVGPATSSVAPDPLATLSADGDGLVAYTPSAGALDAELFGPRKASGPLALSSAALGPVDAAAGQSVASDDHGDLVVGYVAGPAGALSIVAQAYVVAPGAPVATGTRAWTADSRPVLRWQAASAHWAPPTYAVYLDGTEVATTSATSYAVPGELPDGRHTWRVVATDALGQQVSSQAHPLLIDATPPRLTLRIAGRRAQGSRLRFTVAAATIAGVRRVAVDYGDGHAGAQLRSTHAYARPGRYAVTVVVADRAGVRAQIGEHVTIG